MFNKFLFGTQNHFFSKNFIVSLAHSIFFYYFCSRKRVEHVSALYLVTKLSTPMDDYHSDNAASTCQKIIRAALLDRLECSSSNS